MSTGELLPAGALGDDAQHAPPAHLMAVPVQSGHLPPGVDRGDLVDVYVTPHDAAARRVLASATVVDVADAGAGLRDPGADVTVVLQVPDGEVPDVVAAVRSGDVDLVGVRPG